MIYILFASISNGNMLLKHQGFLLYPLGFSMDAYSKVFSNPEIISGYMNTIIYVVIGTSLNLVMTSLAAYGLSRKNVMLARPIMLMIIFTMYFSGGLVPNYLLMQSLGLIDTRLVLILPTALATFNLLLMKTSFLEISDSLEESARIDGANDIRILFQIFLPMSLPVLAVMVIFYGVANWNAWFNAMIYLESRQLYPLQLILREIILLNSLNKYTTDYASVDMIPVGETIKFATIIVTTLPILLIYPFMQKYFVKGVSLGAVKE
jgi:putative aldouronate transport system permease protein